MANTPNINLVKPLGTDKALVSVINDNSDKIDAFAGSANTNMANTQNGYAIVVDGNNAPKAITAGQYLFIKNHSTLSAGGYHATANIANGAAITSSNVAADADGVVNGAFAALNDNIAGKVSGPGSATDGTIPLYDGTSGKAIKAGKSITDVTTSTAIANNANIPTNRTVRNGIYNDLDKTAAGFALDARQGKALQDKLSGLGLINCFQFNLTAGSYEVTAYDNRFVKNRYYLVLHGLQNEKTNIYVKQCTTAGQLVCNAVTGGPFTQYNNFAFGIGNL